MEIGGDILKVIGLIICIISAIMSWNRAMTDDNMEKSDIYWGRYLIEYEGFTKLLILGILLLFIGFILKY